MTNPAPLSVKEQLEQQRRNTAELAERQRHLFLADLKEALATINPLYHAQIYNEVKVIGFGLIEKQPTFLPSARGLVNLAWRQLTKKRQDAEDRERIAHPHRFSHRPAKPESFSERLNRSMDHLLKRRDYRRRQGAVPHPQPPFPDEVQP